MIVVRAARFMAALIFFLLSAGCGQNYRPVAVPITPSPPNPAFTKSAFVLTDNGPLNPGSSSQIDVSGDTTVGVVKTGAGPVHGVLTPDATRVYVANEFENTVSEFPVNTPNSANLQPITTISLPPGSNPVFVTAAQNTVVYAANFLAGTVAAISTSLNAVTQIISLDRAGPNPNIQPVAMAETPNGTRLYVANQGNGTSTAGSVTSINPTDNSVNGSVAGSWVKPVWVVSRSDSARAYVLDSGAGEVFAINTSSDAVLPNPVPVGAGANFMFYDGPRNRLYVTNPANGSVSVVDVSADPPSLLATDCAVSGSTPPCPVTFAPVSVAALSNGGGAYVASYEISSNCSGVTGPCITSQVSVIGSASNALVTVIPLGSVSVDMTDQTVCGPPNPVSSRAASRFRLSIAASGDSSRVYVANCDAGSTTILSAVPTSSDPYPANSVITNLVTPVSAFPPRPSNGGLPPTQNPVFVFTSP